MERRFALYGDKTGFPLLANPKAGTPGPFESAFTTKAAAGGFSPGRGQSFYTHSGTGHFAGEGAKQQFGLLTSWRFGNKEATHVLPARPFLYWDRRMFLDTRRDLTAHFNRLKRTKYRVF